MKFLTYQTIRKTIPITKSFKIFKESLDKFNLNSSMKLGLIREFRAFYWLKKKYKNDFVKISLPHQDKQGIDIIIHKNFSSIHKIYFAVSGFADNEDHNNCNYKIIVGKDKIYQKKI